MLLVAVVRIKIIWATFLALWTNFYQHATLLLPSLLTAPRYFAGEIEFGVITQVPHPISNTALRSFAGIAARYPAQLVKLHCRAASPVLAHLSVRQERCVLHCCLQERVVWFPRDSVAAAIKTPLLARKRF